MTSFYLAKSLGTEELQNCKIITHSPCWSASKPGVAMTMTSETAQELREGGSSKPRAIEYAGHTLKFGTICFSSIVNLHCRTYDRQILTLGNSIFLFFLNWIISDLRQICVLKLNTGKKCLMWVNLLVENFLQ